jgi:hypothetical protein
MSTDAITWQRDAARLRNYAFLLIREDMRLRVPDLLPTLEQLRDEWDRQQQSQSQGTNLRKRTQPLSPDAKGSANPAKVPTLPSLDSIECSVLSDGGAAGGVTGEGLG